MARASVQPANGDAIRDLWRALPYHGFGLCANPDCTELANCCGVNPDSRICIGCFEFAYAFRAPNLRRVRAA